MASKTSLPEQPAAHGSSHRSETEPLLGTPGDAASALTANIVRGRSAILGILAQAGVIILCGNIWVHIASTPATLFSGHPMAMSTAIFILTQSILSQQPITAEDLDRKRRGQYIHAALNLAAFVALVTGFTIVEIEVARMKGSHFPSTHSICGLLTLILLVVQYIVGFTMWLTPSLYGGEARAKSLYKYHRYGGYFILLMLLTTVVAATLTGYNKALLGVGSWVTGLAALLIAIGVFPRIQKQKLGFQTSF